MIFKTCARIYRYVFYKLYRWSEVINPPGSGLHDLSAIIMLSFAVMINLGTIPAIVQLITGYEAIAIFSIPKYFGAVIAIFIFFVNYVLLKKIGYKKIIQEFSQENPSQRKLGNTLVTSYVLGSLVLLFASFALVVFRDSY